MFVHISFVFKNNDNSGASKKDKKTEIVNEIDKKQDSESNSKDSLNVEHSKVTKFLSSSPTPATKPPIPAPRAINNHEKFKNIGKLIL